MSGATQNIQSCSSAYPPTTRAGEALRAGFTELLVEPLWRPLVGGAHDHEEERRARDWPRFTAAKKHTAAGALATELPEFPRRGAAMALPTRNGGNPAPTFIARRTPRRPLANRPGRDHSFNRT